MRLCIDTWCHFLQGYDNLELRTKVELDTEVEVNVKFPQGSVVSAAHDTVPVEVRFTGTQ